MEEKRTTEVGAIPITDEEMGTIAGGNFGPIPGPGASFEERAKYDGRTMSVFTMTGPGGTMEFYKCSCGADRSVFAKGGMTQNLGAWAVFDDVKCYSCGWQTPQLRLPNR